MKNYYIDSSDHLITKLMTESNLLISKELLESNLLLAAATKIAAELLAKTTQENVEQMRMSNDISAKLMKRLTIILVIVGLVQIILSAITAFK